MITDADIDRLAALARTMCESRGLLSASSRDSVGYAGHRDAYWASVEAFEEGVVQLKHKIQPLTEGVNHEYPL